MNHALLDQRLARLAAHDHTPPAHAGRLAGYLRDTPPASLHRINPLAAADTLDLPADEAIDLCVHAARTGIFDLAWHLFCPSCGGYLNTGGSVNELGGETVANYCWICHVDVPIALDDFVEVSFTLSPDILPADDDPLRDMASYRDSYFSRAVVPDPAFARYISARWRGYTRLGPGETTETFLDGSADPFLRLVSVLVHADRNIPVSGEPCAEPQVVDVVVGERGFETATAGLRPGPWTVRLTNVLPAPVGVTLWSTDISDLPRMLAAYPNTYRPFLTGKALLNNQAFRDHYRFPSLVAGLKLNVRSLTVLFTDLKGSTEMYDDIGDVTAYGLIQDHFRVLGQAVRAHAGAIVKTMGDAIMATFSHPADGVAAALDMLEAIDSLRDASGRALGLKVGLHEGPTLAINNDGQLDYFGQTVNIAARVQGLAAAGELWLTDDCHGQPGVPDLLTARGYGAVRSEVALKGVGKPMGAWRIRFPAPR